MKPKHWKTVLDDLNDHEQQMDAEKRTHPEWRVHSLSLLPSGVFVWRDELEEAIGKSRYGAGEHADSLDDDEISDGISPNKIEQPPRRDLNSHDVDLLMAHDRNLSQDARNALIIDKTLDFSPNCQPAHRQL